MGVNTAERKWSSLSPSHPGAFLHQRALLPLDGWSPGGLVTWVSLTLPVGLSAPGVREARPHRGWYKPEIRGDT